MATRTLLALRTSAKQRANLENSSFVTDSEWDSYINYSISELRDILTSKVGDDYFAEEYVINLVPGTDTYALPNNFYKALWLQATVNNVTKKLKRFELSELPQVDNSYLALDFPKYRLRANSVWFSPNRTAQAVSLWFVPLTTELSADGDTLEGYNGWDEFIVLKSARKALVKEEQDTSQIDTELLILMQRIEAMSDNRDQAEPKRIQDTEAREGYEWH